MKTISNLTEKFHGLYIPMSNLYLRYKFIYYLEISQKVQKKTHFRKIVLDLL